jgi:hypothetical protein
MLLDGINHIAWISKDAVRLGRFYAEVFDADVGPTRAHGTDGKETMTVIRIGPHTELNMLRGEPGIGKSRLLKEAAARARRHHMTVLTATGVQAEARLPFSGAASAAAARASSRGEPAATPPHRA